MSRCAGVLVLAALLVHAAGAMGGQAGSARLTLDEAIDQAMAANPLVQAVAAGAEAQESGAQAEKNRWLGELMVRGGVALNGDDTLLRPITREIMASGPANMPFDEQYAFWSLDYRLPIYSGGSLGGVRESARFAAAASRRNLHRISLGVRHEVLKTYVDLLSVDARTTAWQEELEALDSLVDHIELGREAGMYSRVDVLKTRVEQQNVVARAQSLRMEWETGYATLMALLGADEETTTHYELAPVDVAAADTLLPPVAALVDSALVRRSDLQALKDVAAARRADAEVVGGSRLPQVSIGGRLSGSHGGTIDFDDTWWSVDATVSMPLLDMGRRRNLTRKADLYARSADLDVRELAGRIRAEVMVALAAVTNSRSNIITQETTLALAGEVSRLEQLRYDAGRGDIDNLLKSRSGHRVAEAALTQSRHDLLIALNNLQLTIEGECR